MLGLVLYWIVVMVRHPEGNVHPTWSHTWGLTFVDLLSACLIVMALDSASVTFHIFNLRPLRWLGRISYGAYVFHDILNGEHRQFVTDFYADDRRIVTAIFALVCTLLLSWASFKWFETPFIRLKERWTVRANPKVSSR